MVVDGSLIEREEEEEIKAMNVSVLSNAVGGAVIIASNATST
jgi:hypothetical protein